MELRQRGYLTEAKFKLTPGKFALVVTNPHGDRSLHNEYSTYEKATAVMKAILTRWHKEKPFHKWQVSLIQVWKSGKQNLLWHRDGKQGPR